MQNTQGGGCRSRVGCFFRVLLFVAIGFGLGAFAVSDNLTCQRISGDALPGWITPDYYVANGWSNPGNAKDNNTLTYSFYNTPDETWSPWLELWLDYEIIGDRVRMWSRGTYVASIQVDVRYGGAWHNIYNSGHTKNQWVTYTIGSTQEVIAMRTRGYQNNVYSVPSEYLVNEVDFYGHFPPDDLDVTPETDTNYTGTYHEFTAYVTNEYGNPVPYVDLTWQITSGPGYWIDYDEETNAGGYGYATLLSMTPGMTAVKCICTDYPGVWDNVIKWWEYPPDSLTLVPESDLNYWGDEHTLNATIYDEISDPIPGFDVTWSIESGSGWFVDYDEATDENGSAYAVITSNISGITVIKCVADGFPDVYDTATKTWESPFWPTTLILIPEYDTNYVGTNHTITAIIYDQNDDAMPGMGVTWSIESGSGWFVFSGNTTDNLGRAQSIITSDVTGNTTIRCVTNNLDHPNINATAVKIWEKGGIEMPIWYIIGLAILAAGAWWARSFIVNIMVIAMAGAGFPLMEEALEAGGATYWGIYLILILAVVYALISIFTRAEHW